MKLVPAVRHLAFESQRIHSAIELRSYFEQSVRSIPQLVLISKEVEPIVIQESSSIAEDGFKSSTLSLSSKFMQKSVSSTSSHPRRKDYAEEMFVGLGAIRYVPSFVGDRDSFKQKRMSDLSAPSSPITNTSPSAINPEILEEIERVNIKLANALSASTIELKSWNRLFVKAKLYDEEDFADGVKQQFIGRKASTSAMLKRYSVELWGDHLEDKSNSPTSPTAKSAPVTISSSMKKSPFGNTLASWNNMHSMEYKTCIRIGLVNGRLRC